MPYTFLENVAIADVAFEATAKTLNGLFKAVALATFEVMCNLKKVSHKVEKKILLENESVGNLLFDFLSELVYLKDAEALLFSKFEVKISVSKKEKKYFLRANVFGEEINTEKHDLKADVKAVTLHMFKVEKVNKEWRAFVVLDI